MMLSVERTNRAGATALIRPWWLCLAVGVLVLAAGCGGGDTDEGTVSESDQVETAAAPESTDTDVDSSESDGSSEEGDADSEAPDGGEEGGEDEADANDSGEPESLDDFFDSGVAGLFAGGGGNAGFNQDSLREEQRQIEQRVQECMVLQGFEYEQQQAGGAGFATFFEAVGQAESLTPEEYAAQEGFGISTIYDAITAGVTAAIDEGAEASDPNQEMLDQMSEGERNAWYITLEGQPFETDDEGRRIDPETGEVVEGLGQFAASGGCRFEAQGLVRENFAAIQELSDEFEELDNRIDADPRISEIRRDWSDCIGGAGYFYEDEDEARADIQSQFVPFALGALGGAASGQLPELSDERAAALADLQDLERDVAVASLECQGDTAEEIEEIRARYEAEFIDNNRTALEAIRGG